MPYMRSRASAISILSTDFRSWQGGTRKAVSYKSCLATGASAIKFSAKRKSWLIPFCGEVVVRMRKSWTTSGQAISR